MCQLSSFDIYELYIILFIQNLYPQQLKIIFIYGILYTTIEVL